MAITQRMARLREKMAATDTDLVVLGPSSHMVYMSTLSPHGDERPVLMVVGRQKAGFLMPALNADSQRPHTDLPFYTWSDAEGPHAALTRLLADVLGDVATPSVVLDETMRTDFSLFVLDMLPGARRRFTKDTVSALRACKDETEYQLLKASQAINDGAMRAGFAALKPGVTELEVAGAIRAYYKANGAAPEFTSVCFGPNGAFPHHHTGNTVLKAGDAVLIDIGGRKDGYPSDMTRVAHMGAPDAEFAKVHAVLERAVQAAIAMARPGVMARQIDAAARDVIAAEGYGDFFLHRTGHGMGIDVHEEPYITGTNERIIEEGNVFSIEPGIYLAGKFGIRLEEIVIVRAGWAEVLSDLPRATHVVPA